MSRMPTAFLFTAFFGLGTSQLVACGADPGEDAAKDSPEGICYAVNKNMGENGEELEDFDECVKGIKELKDEITDDASWQDFAKCMQKVDDEDGAGECAIEAVFANAGAEFEKEMEKLGEELEDDVPTTIGN